MSPFPGQYQYDGAQLTVHSHQTFFQRQAETIPIINQQRYLQEFYSPPHMKPPMCLQYAIWSIAALENEKYRASSEVFYQRSRQYAEADEMKVSHVQLFF